MYKLDSEYDIHANFHFKSLCICYVNSGYLHTKQTEISQKQSEQTKSYFIFFLRSEIIFYFFCNLIGEIKAVEPMFLFLKI
jgi:hypothetical protein